MITPTTDPGVDYGGGTTNVDPETGIRFGVIGMNAIPGDPWEGLEADFGDPACPACGGDVTDYEDVADDRAYRQHKPGSCSDYVCEECLIVLGSDEVTGDEPVGHVLDRDGYTGRVDSHSDLVLTKSPYYTHAQFCSPCAPGAGHLEHPCPAGPRTYCLGYEWFPDGKAPYPVYRVATGEPVAQQETK